MQAILQNISVVKKQENLKQKQKQISWISGNRSFPYKVVSVQMEVGSIHTLSRFDSLKVVSIQSNNLLAFEDLVNIYQPQIIERFLSVVKNKQNFFLPEDCPI